MNVCIFRLVFHEHVSGWGKGLSEGGVAALLGDGDEVVSGAVGAAWGPRGCHTVAGIVPFRDSLEDPARGHQCIAGGHSGGRRPPRWLRRESGRRSGALACPVVALCSRPRSRCTRLVCSPCFHRADRGARAPVPSCAPKRGQSLGLPCQASLSAGWGWALLSAMCPVCWYLDHLPL